MITIDYKKECLKIIPGLLEKNGEQKQVCMAIEEMSELTKELLKNKFRDKENVNAIFEELGDVLFCMNMLLTIYEIDENELFAILYKKLQDRDMLQSGVDIINGPDIQIEATRDVIHNYTTQNFYQGGKIIKTLRIYDDGTTVDVPLD